MRSTRTSSVPPSPMRRVSTWMPARGRKRRLRLTGRRSCRCRRTAARSASGRRPGTGRMARRSAAPMSRRRPDRCGGDPVDLRRGRPAGARRARPCRRRRSRPRPRPASPRASRAGTRAPPPARRSRRSRTGRRRTPWRAGRPAGRAGSRRAPARGAVSRTVRTMSASRRRPIPSRRRAPGAARWSGPAPGPAGGARAARRRRCPSARCPVAAVPRRPAMPRRRRASASRSYTSHSAVSTMRTIRTIGTHSSSRVVGRSVAPLPPPDPAPGGLVRQPELAQAPRCRATSPGAMRRFVHVEQVDRESDRGARVGRAEGGRGARASRTATRSGCRARRRSAMQTGRRRGRRLGGPRRR